MWYGCCPGPENEGCRHSKEVEAVKHYDMFKMSYVYVSLAPLLWSTNFILAKILITDVSAVTIVAGRLVVATAALALLLKHYEKKFPHSK